MNWISMLTVFCVLAIVGYPHVSNAEREPSHNFRWPLTPNLGRFPSPSELKQKTSNLTEEQFWEKVRLGHKNMQSIRREPSEILAMMNRDLEKHKSDEMETDFFDDNRECVAHVRKMIRDGETERYAIQMWDSWGTGEGGLLEGNVRWPGHYYECRMSENEDFSGKWCLSYYGLILLEIQNGIPFDLTLGICFPSTCSNDAIEYIYLNYFIAMDFPPLLDVRCPADPKWMDIDTICSVVIGILTTLLLAGTVFDLLMRYKNISKDKQTSTLSNKLLMSFSVISNTEQIIDMKTKKGNIQTLDGIRVITTTWVVIGHVLQMFLQVTDNAAFAKRQILKDPGFMVVINAFYSVDTFFFLSGLLVTYLGLKHLDKTKGFLNVPLFYLQRYLRLTPVYAFAILFHMSLYKFLGDGPGWYSFTNSNYQSCKEAWWANLLYISNIYPQINNCFAVAWYLADDMQMFLLSPVFILLFYHFIFTGIFAAVTTFVNSVLYNGLVSFYYELQPTVISVLLPLSYFYRWLILGWFLTEAADYSYHDKWLTDLYFMPWARIHVYMIGMLTGYFLYVTKGKIKMHKIVVVIGWVVAAGSALGVVYGPYEYVKNMEWMPNDLSAFYNAMCRPVFVAAVAWVVIACCSGYGGPVTKLLDWKVFKPLSRLTYSTYIVHIYVLYYFAYTQEKPIHFQTINFIYIFLSTVVLSFGCGYIFAVFVEWPFMGICKALFYPSPPRKSNKTELPTVKKQDSNSEWSSYEEHVIDGDHSSLEKNGNKADYINDSYSKNESQFKDDTKF